MRLARSWLAPLVLLLAVVSFSACSEDDSPTGGVGTLDPPDFDVSGDWLITENVNATACGEGTYIDSYTLGVTQNGNSITVISPVGTFTGTISASTIRWSGSFPDDGGVTTLNSLVLTVTGGGDTLNGTSSWTWRENGGGFTCSGSTQISGSKLDI